MECPYCNKQMEKGVTQSAREIFFANNPHRYIFKPRETGEVSLSYYNMTRPTCVSYICRNCKKVVIDYSKKPD